jgi:hypothetical protein
MWSAGALACAFFFSSSEPNKESLTLPMIRAGYRDPSLCSGLKPRSAFISINLRPKGFIREIRG